jgi:aminoglycoside phosphotransferase (APT) family kinase protein
MHADELDVPADLVRRLLELTFPQWAELPLVHLPSYGTDARLYRLGSELVVRLPKIHWATSQIEMEQRLLPRLAPRSDLLMQFEMRPASAPGVGLDDRSLRC